MKISIEGLPGCKKLPIIKILREKHGLTVATGLPVKQLIDSYRDNPRKYALSYLLDRLVTYHQGWAHHDDDDEPRNCLFESLYALRKVYAEYLLGEGVIEQHEYDSFMKVYHLIHERPDIIIYFYGDVDESYNRTVESGCNYTLEEYKKLQCQYEWAFDANNCKIPIYKVNINDDLPRIERNVLEILDKLAGKTN